MTRKTNTPTVCTVEGIQEMFPGVETDTIHPNGIQGRTLAWQWMGPRQVPGTRAIVLLRNTYHASMVDDFRPLANVRWVKENWADGEGVWWFTANTALEQDLYLMPSAIPEDKAEEVEEVLDRLENEGLISDETYQEVYRERMERALDQGLLEGVARDLAIPLAAKGVGVRDAVQDAREMLGIDPAEDGGVFFFDEDDIAAMREWIRHNVLE